MKAEDHKCSKCNRFFIDESKEFKIVYNALSGQNENMCIGMKRKPACGLNAAVVMLRDSQIPCKEYGFQFTDGEDND